MNMYIITEGGITGDSADHFGGGRADMARVLLPNDLTLR